MIAYVRRCGDDSLKDTRKYTSLRDMFAKGAKPKTVSGPEAPTAEVAPKEGNNSSEEVVVGPKEMKYWNDVEKNQMLANILKCTARIKKKAALQLYKFIGFGALDVTKPHEYIGFGDIHGPKPYKFIRFR